jgi:hypothetical protein
MLSIINLMIIGRSVHPEGSATKMDETQTRVPFKAKVEGYAKKFAGKS